MVATSSLVISNISSRAASRTRRIGLAERHPDELINSIVDVEFEALKPPPACRLHRRSVGMLIGSAVVGGQLYDLHPEPFAGEIGLLPGGVVDLIDGHRDPDRFQVLLQAQQRVEHQIRPAGNRHAELEAIGLR